MRASILALLLCLGCEVEVDTREVAEAAFRAGEYEAAANAFVRALATAPPEERPQLMARHGHTLKLLGRNDAAEQALVGAIHAADARSQGEVGAQARRYLGRLYADLGRNDEAEARYAQAEAWYREHGPADELVKLQVHRAAVAWHDGSFDRAWTLYQDVYFRALTLEDTRLQANGLDGMAMLLAYVGELADARALVVQTALMHETAGRPADAAVAYATQGIIAVAEGNAAEGLRLADLALAHATGMQATRVQALAVRAAAAAEANDAVAALQAADQASAEAATIGMVPLRLEAELVALEALATLGRWSALAARADALRPETEEQKARLEVLRARHAAARGDAAARRRHLEAAVAGFDRLRAALGIEHLSSALTRTRRSAYDDLITVLAEAGEAEAALRVVGSVKARALAERLRAEKDAPPPEPTPPAAGSTSPLPSPRTVERAGNLFRLAAPQPPADPAALRALLPPAIAVVEYYTLPDRLLVFWLAADHVEVESVPVGAQALEATVQQLLIEIRAKGNGYLPHAARLGQWLLNPVARHLGRSEADPLTLLVVVPHGPLHPVPFEALPWAGRLLIDRYAVVTQPNLTAVAAALQAPAARPFEAVVAVGDPRENLPGAREEAVELAARFPGGRALVGGEASESKVREILKETGESDLLHFAVHGIRPGPDQPLYLELMPDSAFDGRLHADELATLKVPAGLVVLSVCDSASGRGETGDEIPWVVDRAFLEAGARTVLASRWPVHDAASVLFMRNFYAALAQPTPGALGGPIDAFRRAQLALRNGRAKPEELGPLLAVLDNARGVQDPPGPEARIKDFTHPYFWATFSLRGSWR